MDAATSKMMKHRLEEIIDPKTDSLRFYYLGNNYKNKIEHIGAKKVQDVTDTLII